MSRHRRLPLDDALDRGLDLSVSGYHLCVDCQKATEVEGLGEPYQRCKRCGSGRVKWHPPVKELPPSPRNARDRRTLFEEGWERATVMLARKRLPDSKRNLVRMGMTGYWFCFFCGQVTETKEGGGKEYWKDGELNLEPSDDATRNQSEREPMTCCLCEQRQAVWQKPIEV